MWIENPLLNRVSEATIENSSPAIANTVPPLNAQGKKIWRGYDYQRDRWVEILQDKRPINRSAIKVISFKNKCAVFLIEHGVGLTCRAKQLRIAIILYVSMKCLIVKTDFEYFLVSHWNENKLGHQSPFTPEHKKNVRSLTLLKWLTKLYWRGSQFTKNLAHNKKFSSMF